VSSETTRAQLLVIDRLIFETYFIVFILILIHSFITSHKLQQSKIDSMDDMDDTLSSSLIDALTMFRCMQQKTSFCLCNNDTHAHNDIVMSCRPYPAKLGSAKRVC
jgi:hypothetical protein